MQRWRRGWGVASSVRLWNSYCKCLSSEQVLSLHWSAKTLDLISNQTLRMNRSWGLARSMIISSKWTVSSIMISTVNTAQWRYSMSPVVWVQTGRLAVMVPQERKRWIWWICLLGRLLSPTRFKFVSSLIIKRKILWISLRLTQRIHHQSSGRAVSPLSPGLPAWPASSSKWNLPARLWSCQCHQCPCQCHRPPWHRVTALALSLRLESLMPQLINLLSIILPIVADKKIWPALKRQRLLLFQRGLHLLAHLHPTCLCSKISKLIALIILSSACISGTCQQRRAASLSLMIALSLSSAVLPPSEPPGQTQSSSDSTLTTISVVVEWVRQSLAWVAIECFDWKQCLFLHSHQMVYHHNTVVIIAQYTQLT